MALAIRLPSQCPHDAEEISIRHSTRTHGFNRPAISGTCRAASASSAARLRTYLTFTVCGVCGVGPPFLVSARAAGTGRQAACRV